MGEKLDGHFIEAREHISQFIKNPVPEELDIDWWTPE